MRGDAERDISSLGAMGWGGWWRLPGNSSAAAAAAHPKSGCLVIIVFLRFLTHNRDLDALLVGIDS